MSEYREQALARLDGKTLGLVGGGSLQLVTVCLTDEGAGEISDEHGRPLPPTAPVFTYLCPREARELAFRLLEVAELADRRSELTR